MKKHTPLSIRQLLVVAALLLAFSAMTLFLFSFRQDEKRFVNITSRLFVEEMTANTLNMHYSLAFPADYGIYDYEVILPGYSAEGNKNSQIAAENTLAALKAIHMENLSYSDAYLYQLLVRSLENTLKLGSYTYYQEPLSPSSGMQTQLPVLLAEYAFRSKRDVEDYLKLLDQTDDYFASLLTYEQEKAAAGLCMPAFALQEVRLQCDTIVTKEELENGTHFLQVTFKERLEELYNQGEITLEEAEKYLMQNNRLLKTVLLPAYINLGDGLILLEDNSTQLSGLSVLPQGKEYYQVLLTTQTGSYRSVEQIQEMLARQFSSVYNSLQQLVKEHPEIVMSYASSQEISFPYTEPSQMLMDLQQRMANDFPAIPGETVSVTVKTVSESLEDYCAPAFYLTAPMDDSSRNVIYINNQKTPSGLDLYTTLAHEGYPGHLYQTVYDDRSSAEAGERPVRELLWYGGYLEGWALYVEFLSFDYAYDLLLEQGLEQDALRAQVEKYNRSLQLCLYSMLDIMIHYENASFSHIAEILERFGITDTASAQAIYTYIALEPCNYLKYYVGYLELLALQDTAIELWGAQYSDYQFHCFLLDTGPADFISLSDLLGQWSPNEETLLLHHALQIPSVPEQDFQFPGGFNRGLSEILISQDSTHHPVIVVTTGISLLHRFNSYRGSVTLALDGISDTFFFRKNINTIIPAALGDFHFLKAAPS